MGPNAQYYQRHRKTARNYTTDTRFENVIFGGMGDNFQHFLLVHMLLQTKELHTNYVVLPIDIENPYRLSNYLYR